jgi:hypothetical protein
VKKNKAAIMTAENECSAAERMKHVDVKFRSVQESIKLFYQTLALLRARGGFK